MSAAVAAVAVTMPLPALTQQAFPPDDALEPMLRYLVEDHETPGIVLGLLEGDGTTRVLAWGKGGANPRPLGPRSVFRIGPITMTFTGVLLADMARRGEVSLDDPVEKFLPQAVTVPASRERPITLLDLATHRSGLPSLSDIFEPADPQTLYTDYTLEMMYDFLSRHEPGRAPGTEVEPSDLGMGLLAHALARAAGTSYPELLRERILEPLEMTMTGYAAEGEIARWMTIGHERSGEAVPHRSTSDAMQGAVGLLSTAADMLKYLNAGFGPPKTDLEWSLREAQSYTTDLGGASEMGLGWRRLSWNGRSIYVQGGGSAGYDALVAVDGESGVGVVRLTNTQRLGDDLALDLMRFGAPVYPSGIDVPAEVLADYPGEYQTPDGPMFVRLEDEGYLTLQLPGDVRHRLYAHAESEFFLKRFPWRLRFTVAADGAVTGAELDQTDGELPAARVGPPHTPPAAVAGNPISRVRELSLPVQTMEMYRGTYSVQVGSHTVDLLVLVQEEKLMVHPEGQDTTELIPVAEHEFMVANDRSSRLVFDVLNGEVRGVQLHQDGAVFRGVRKLMR